jgi:hypothetical protein
VSGRSPDPGTSVPARRKPLPRRSEVRLEHGGGVRAGSGNVTPRQARHRFNHRENQVTRKPRR